MPPARLIDLEHLGQRRALGAWIVDEEVLVDPGPATSLPRLLEELGDWRPRAIALTHIHLDHAGATGALVRRWPGVEVWVDERGAPHVVDPERLLRSARRIYGDELEALWGIPEPVPADAVRALGDRDTAGPFDVAHTPGHASHHVAYFHPASGVAFVGDVAGVRIGEGAPVLAPTVAPEFDPRLWNSSLDRVASWRPRALALTHFGLHLDVDVHVAALRRALERLVATGGAPAAIRSCVDEILEGVDDKQARAAYEHAARPATFSAGIERYLARARDG